MKNREISVGLVYEIVVRGTKQNAMIVDSSSSSPLRWCAQPLGSKKCIWISAKDIRRLISPMPPEGGGVNVAPMAQEET